MISPKCKYFNQHITYLIKNQAIIYVMDVYVNHLFFSCQWHLYGASTYQNTYYDTNIEHNMNILIQLMSKI